MKIVFLTEQFYKDYDCRRYREILHKNGRPYAMLLAKIDNLTFAIPFRSNIRHKNCFVTFCKSDGQNCGIDYSKAVVISDKEKYIKDIGRLVVVREEEYKKIIYNKYKIIHDFSRYVANYRKNILKNIAVASYKYSTLQYFHKELGLS